MKVTLNANMIIGILNAWAQRNLESEGFEIDTYAFNDKNELVITMKVAEEDRVEVEGDPED